MAVNSGRIVYRGISMIGFAQPRRRLSQDVENYLQIKRSNG
jgi:hypothetical protein